MLIEYGAGIPLIVLLIVAFTDIARLYWTIDDAYRVINETARRGSVCGEVGYACPELNSYAKSISYPLSTVTYNISYQNCGKQPDGYAQNGVYVSAKVDFTFISPLELYAKNVNKYKSWTISTCFSRSL